MVYGIYNELVTRAYKPTYILGASHCIYIYIFVGGIPTPLKNDGVKVSWDDDILN